MSLLIVKFAYQILFVHLLFTIILSITTITKQQCWIQNDNNCDGPDGRSMIRSYYYVAAAADDMKKITTTQNQDVDESIIVDDLSNQIMNNVVDRLDCLLESLLEKGMVAVDTFIDLRNNNIFQYNMTSPDRELIYNLFTSIGNKHDNTLDSNIYIGLEDGTYFTKGYSGQVSYREPGNNGYTIKDIQPDNPYYKYYIACVDSWDGVPLNCTMKYENSTYIECIDNCEPIPCNTSSKNNVNDDDEEESNITYLCRNYVTKEVGPYDMGTLGYIPNTAYCINKNQQPEQRPGYVDIEYDRLGNGSCYYWDYKTIVNRTLNGNYAQCGPNKICNTTYQGGYYEDDEDPRLTDWYIETKSTLSPTWTEAYLNSYGSSISISYNKPIYTTKQQQQSLNDNTTNNNITTELLLFDGVIGQSFDLGFLQKYLLEAYKNANIRVLLLEDTDPYYVIGTSIEVFHLENVTVSLNDTIVSLGKVTNGITKWVSINNLNEFCPYLNGSNPYEDDITNKDTHFPSYYSNCIWERVPIHEFYDNVSYQAFLKYKESNFTRNNKGIYYKEDETIIGTQAYVAYAELFAKENIRWHVLLITPINRSTSDAVLKNDPMFIGVCILATIGVILCLVMFILFYQKRTEKAIIQADWRFTCAFIFGCSCINMSSYTLLGENTDQLCMLRMWSFNGLLVCALSPLFVKVWRMATLLNASVGFQRKVISNWKAFLYTFPLIITELILLMIFSIVDPPLQTEELGVGEGLGYQVVSCEHNSHTFLIIQMIFTCSLILVGCILAYKTKDLDPKYGEASQLAFSMYNIAFTGLITMLVFLFVKLDQDSQILIQTLSVFWASTFSSIAFVLPRLLQARKDRDKRISNATTAHNSNTFHRNSRNNHESTAGVDDEVVELRKDETEPIHNVHDVYHVETVGVTHNQTNHVNDGDNYLMHQSASTKDDIVDGTSPSEMYMGPVDVLDYAVQETISFSKDESNVLSFNSTPEGALDESNILLENKEHKDII